MFDLTRPNRLLDISVAKTTLEKWLKEDIGPGLVEIRRTDACMQANCQSDWLHLSLVYVKPYQRRQHVRLTNVHRSLQIRFVRSFIHSDPFVRTFKENVPVGHLSHFHIS